jgi:mannose-6-phosphate isomerase-like protein (cupin superfamily)
MFHFHLVRKTHMPKKMSVYKITDIPKETRLHQGRMTRYSIRTKHAQVVFAEIQPQPQDQRNYHRTPHDHPHDMMLVVNKGAMRMEIDGIEYDMPAGTCVVIPAFVMHRGFANSDETVSLMEVFAPPRDDYIHLNDYQEDFGDRGVAYVKKELDSWNKPGP